TYNPETDNFERFFPSGGERLWRVVKFVLLSILMGGVIFLLYFHLFESPTEKALRKENSQLRSRYNVINRRLDNSLKVMEDIRNRDDNFYRVMLQLDPMSLGQRYAGLDNERRYKEIEWMPDADLVKLLTQRLDLFERQLYAQSLSFDQLRKSAGEQKDKLAHIPSVMPIDVKDYTVASGYGYRNDPVYGTTKFHEGIDFAAAIGTPVFATADGIVEESGWKGGYGNCIDLSHGYNYTTRYGHLSEVLVAAGKKVKRGELIGKVGSTGKSTGPHLHYEVRFKDEVQNPVNYYFMDLSPAEYSEMIRLADNAGHVMD
ncbi:MAG: peptidoglycan DD-metalloendopeptidase family protein, partial [Muribaculaceae bacterium]|nr:peptidoglycan DD-metalloendopeptidase family protein [Muribaculaceae bacterium]